MSTDITHIKRVEIKGLWGRQDLVWDLHPDVNILAGINGSGKSTILNTVFGTIKISQPQVSLVVNRHQFSNAEIIFNNELKYCLDVLPKSDEESKTFILHFKDGTIYKDELHRLININLITTFDSLIKSSEAIQKLSNSEIQTELDWQISQLQIQYLDYQLDLSKAKDRLLDTSNNPKEAIEKLRSPQIRFWEMLDTLFAETGKKLDRSANEVSFLLDGKTLSPYVLSSGEKQILVILLTVLVQNQKPSILFMDEPEISLHIDWQKKLIGYIRELNPNVQVILATHSPALIMEGWHDKVFEVSDLIVKK